MTIFLFSLLLFSILAYRSHHYDEPDLTIWDITYIDILLMLRIAFLNCNLPALLLFRPKCKNLNCLQNPPYSLLYPTFFYPPPFYLLLMKDPDSTHTTLFIHPKDILSPFLCSSALVLYAATTKQHNAPSRCASMGDGVCTTIRRHNVCSFFQSGKIPYMI